MNFKINKANTVRLKENSWWASSSQSLKVPWLWWEQGVWCEAGVEDEQEEGQQYEPVATGRDLCPSSSCWLADHPPGCPAVSNKWGLGQAGGADGGCIAALHLAEMVVHGGGAETWGTCVLLSPTVTQQVCTYTKRHQGLLSFFGKFSTDFKMRAVHE